MLVGCSSVLLFRHPLVPAHLLHRVRVVKISQVEHTVSAIFANSSSAEVPEVEDGLLAAQPLRVEQRRCVHAAEHELAPAEIKRSVRRESRVLEELLTTK